ncbi:MAG TPA: preprotein translocase subunit SecE [Lachnospiraceae bacterium]|nr:preprotein translocase subunit SecE [Lachnospiraceae bacterium]
MADKKKSKNNSQKQNKSWFKGLKSEFNKIIWPDQKTLGKQTVAVVVISAITCVLITLVDSLGLQIIQLLVG